MNKMLCLFLLAGCTAANPDYEPEPDLGVVADLSSGGGGGEDLSVPGDPTDLLGPRADLTPSECQSGARRCRVDMATRRSVSQQCEAGRWVDDRRCPRNSTCEGGYCKPPPGASGQLEGRSCTTDTTCQALNGYACQPFVMRSAQGTLRVEFFCAESVGSGASGTQCTEATAATACRSGFCDQVLYAPNSQYCYRQCIANADCPMGPVRTSCKDAKIRVEGQPYAGRSCVPQ